MLAFTARCAIVTGVLFGIVPALHGARADLQPALKEGGRESRVAHRLGPPRAGGLRNRASVVLVAAALLLARSFAELLHVDAGFNPSHVLTLRTSLPTPGTRRRRMARAYHDIGRRLREVPGVKAAGAVTGLPLATTRGDWGIRIEGREVTPGGNVAADWQVVTPGYFEAMGTHLDQAACSPMPIARTRCRSFDQRDDGARVLARRQSVGRRLTMGGNARWLTIVGIVADVRHRGLDGQARAEMYRPHTQFRFGSSDDPAVSAMTWAIRTHADPSAAVSFARAAVRRVDPDLGISDVETMEQVVDDATSDRRLNLLLFALLGSLALALAVVGVYGVVAYSVAQRTHEIGVRMAIGARPADVQRMVLADGGRLAVLGVLLGIGLALAAARVLRGLLFHVSPADPATFIGVGMALVAVAMFASYIPARRATRVDPNVALRG